MQLQIDDGFQFGLGMFETICLVDGKPVLLKEHLERINGALEHFGIPQQVPCEEVSEWLESELAEAEKAGEPVPGLHALKIMVSEKNKIFAFRENHYSEDILAKGFCLDYSPIMRNETSPLVRFKTMNYGDNIIEKRRTRDLDIDEVLFLNSRGEVTEGSTTNFFLVRDGRIFTPDAGCGLLPGILRSFVMNSFDLTETCLYPKDIELADECFVTNSLMGIMPVMRVGNRVFEHGPVTKAVQEKYREYLEG